MVLKRYFKGKRVSGVPVNYPEHWSYRGRWSEKKVGHSKWSFKFRATKTRRAKSYGSFGKGTTGKWKINGIQSVKKVGKGKYQTLFKGFKKSLGFKVKRLRG